VVLAPALRAGFVRSCTVRVFAEDSRLTLAVLGACLAVLIIGAGTVG